MYVVFSNYFQIRAPKEMEERRLETALTIAFHPRAAISPGNSLPPLFVPAVNFRLMAEETIELGGSQEDRERVGLIIVR